MTAPRGVRLLRAGAVAAVLAMLLDLPLGRARPHAPWLAVDASASWTQGPADTWTRVRALVDSLRAAGADSLLLFGDSVRGGPLPDAPTDARSRVAAVVDAAVALGRPVTIVTDGALDDAETLERLPRGSVVRVLPAPARPDAAVLRLEAPGGALGGDTIAVHLVVRAGAAGSPARTLALTLADREVETVPLPALGPYDERTVTLDVAVPARDGATRLVARLDARADDAVPANDTLAVPLVVSAAVAAVLVSSAPDLDARYVLAVLRGTRRGPVRGFWRVAAGQWRTDGALLPVAETAVREAVRSAPLVVLHGDTAVLGAPRAATRGALVLMPTPPVGDDHYPVGAGDSPLAAALAGIPWDSLPPLDVAATPDRGYAAVRSRRARRFDERAVVRLTDGAPRVALVPAAGFGRWRLRGGRAAEAFDALWGSLFDWVEGAEPAATDRPAADAVGRGELLPRRATVAAGPVGTAAAAGRVPRAGDAWWLAVLAVLLLCAEWIWRRRIGLR